MKIINFLQENKEVAEMFCDLCDVEIPPEFKTPQDEFGHLAYNISGKTFARAGSGDEYILLEDGSVGFWGHEGEQRLIATYTENDGSKHSSSGSLFKFK